MKRFAWTLSLLVACGGGAAIAPAASIGSTSPATSTSAAVASASQSALAPDASSSSAAPPATPLEAHAMHGPFTMPTHLCKAMSSSLTSNVATKKVECKQAKLPPAPAGSDIGLIRLLVLRDSAMPDASVQHLWLTINGGAFYDPDGEESFTDAATMKRFQTEATPSGDEFFVDASTLGVAPGVRVDFTEVTMVTSTDPSSGKKSGPKLHAVRTSMVICAVGASGAASCLDPIRGELQLATDGAPPPSPKRVPFEPKNGVWTVDANDHLSMLRAAGHFETHEEIALAGSYALIFK